MFSISSSSNLYKSIIASHLAFTILNLVTNPLYSPYNIEMLFDDDWNEAPKSKIFWS